MTTTAPILEREPGSRRGPSTDLLSRLKQETSSEHAAIEAAAKVMDPALCLDQYRKYLEQSFGFYAPVEAMLQRLGAWEALGLSTSERAKLPLLEADLEALGQDPKSLPRCPVPPQLRDVAEAFGCVYVLEGSTLGGRVISRHVQGQLGADVPRRFLDAYGPRTGERWQAFRAALSAAARARNIDDRVIAGARATFEAFTVWLTASGTG